MAMQVGESDSDGPMIDINTTPLIDVMLVLIIMLIITIPIQTHAVKMNMPVGTPPTNLPKPEKVQIDIDAQSQIYWQGSPVSAEELQQRMTQIAALPTQPEVHLRPNKQVPYKVVAMVMASAQRLGVTKIGLVGNEQFI